MKASELKKDKQGSLRVNTEILKLIKKDYGSLQAYFDSKVNQDFKVSGLRIKGKR